MGDIICICGQRFKRYLDFNFHQYKCKKIIEEIMKKDKEQMKIELDKIRNSGLSDEWKCYLVNKLIFDTLCIDSKDINNVMKEMKK